MLIAIINVFFLSSLCVWSGLLVMKDKFPLLQRREHAPSPHPIISVLLTLLFTAVSLYFVATSNKTPELPTIDALIQNNLAQMLLFVILAASLVFSNQGITWPQQYGITLQDLGEQISDGVYAWLLAILPVFMVQILISQLIENAPSHQLIEMVLKSGSARLWLQVIIAAVIVAPVLEELMFRVILQNWLLRLMPAWGAIFLTALIFSAMHGLPFAFGLFPLALILGITYHNRFRYFTVVTTHVLFNATNLLFVYLSPSAPVN